MAVLAQNEHWTLRSCQYMGEISALSLISFPHRLSSLPYLLAGSGSEILVYDLELGVMVSSFVVFEGIRVHGISCYDSLDSETKTLAVFGERRVKLFILLVDDKQSRVGLDLTMLQCLPKFSSWVLDVCFFNESNPSLAIGCSDNSVCIWDISKSRIIVQVQSPERSLLYSMRLWGDSLEALRISSGTIYNEIIVWKIIPQNDSVADSLDHKHRMYKAVHTCKLVGHEGSIFRLAWSTDGSKLVSVSDDRSARIWEVSSGTEDSDKLWKSGVLFGHSARVWDCCISDSLIVTAGEDCSCRVWGIDGKQLQVIKEHLGRGIWRCLYDSKSSLIITAGFDSSIKVHQLDNKSLSMSLDSETKDNYRTSLYMFRTPSSSDHIRITDSKSEYVRCLRFTCEDSLYVATNNGYLYHAKLSENGDVSWTEIIQVAEKMPIVCLDLLSKRSNPGCADEDWIAVGDGKGNLTVVKVIFEVCSPKLGITLTWSAGQERQLLGTHWCKPLGYSYIFTTDPRGTVKLWKLCDLFQSFPDDTDSRNVSLVAEFASSFGIRIMCLDASLEDEVLVCGDKRGNLVLFPFSKCMLMGSGFASNTKISASNYFKGAHGISSVTGVSIARLSAFQVEICSTGGDGCICYLEYDREGQNLEFTGMKQVKELSLIQSVCSGTSSGNETTSAHYVAGFTSVDFMIWNLKTETKIMQIPCGGWRRPHSYYIGDLPEIKKCFAYVKDEVIHIHRHWIPDGCRKIYPQNLHMQFHGREMHSLCFITDELLPETNGKHSLVSESSWIATGCEDGSVRLTRYTPGFKNWTESKLLGEHVGGSAVRSICSVSKMHIISANTTKTPEGRTIEHASGQDRECPFLLISVGAKRVLTSWLLRNNKLQEAGETLANGRCSEAGNESSSEKLSSISFQWLSTDMPPKYSNANKSMETTGKIIGVADNTSSMNVDDVREDEKMQLKSCARDKCEDDWRYLAVTAFLVKCAGSRLTVCFVVVACSDATLVLRALVLPLRLWFDVAFLAPLLTPVLALQHVIIPTCPPSKENNKDGNIYIVISGATDGSIAFWDLTGSVETFMGRTSILEVEKFIDYQKRPRTGRGSQGGRQWRSLRSSLYINRRGSEPANGKSGPCGNHITNETITIGNSSTNSITANSRDILVPSHNLESSTDDSSEICEISPLHVLEKSHQSGVNCLHVSDVKGFQSSDGSPVYNVLSGGDDQALHCLRFALTVTRHKAGNYTTQERELIAGSGNNNFGKTYEIKNKNCWLKFLYHDEVLSGHTSAVKGIWTDGSWVFSTGLDQRIRCWRLDELGKLTEYAHVIISVPEPEALNARICSGGQYQIAVVGRGMQMAEFSAIPDLN